MIKLTREQMVEALKVCYTELEPKLETKVGSLSRLSEKAACVWLFIRNRDILNLLQTLPAAFVGSMNQYFNQKTRVL